MKSCSIDKQVVMELVKGLKFAQAFNVDVKSIISESSFQTILGDHRDYEELW